MTATTEATKARSQAKFPILYARPEAMTSERHGTLGLTARADFGFARGAHAIPVVATEMPSAMRSYPIVFVGDGHAPVIITGLRQDQNLFVESDGRWSQPHYIPAYVRRYPFILADQEGKLALCVDRASDRVTARPAADAGKFAPFFDGHQPSVATKQALAFCEQFQKDFNKTRAMVEKIAEHGLFATRQNQVKLDSGEVLNVADFQVVDEPAFNRLDDQAFLDLRRSGALGLIYCHLASLNSWPSLAHQAKIGR